MPDHSTEAPTPSRRNLLKGALAASVAPAALQAAAAPGGENERTRQGRGERPNIIFILADDLGWADLGCYGHPEFRTPVLDELARQGSRLTQAYSNSAVCTPTRVGFLTGRYQQRLPIGLQEPLGYVGQLTPQQRATLGISPHHPTIASLLAAAGYETALIGKWHAGYLPAFSPLKSGFRHFYGVFSGGVDYFSHQDNNGEPDLWEGETSIKNNGYITQLLSRRAQRFIEQAASSARPFYLSLHYTSPHWPWEGPGDAARSGHTGSLFDNNGGSLKIYRSMVENLDAEIGRVLQTLRATGQERQTLVVFTSDNGGERFSNMWPFFGKKGDLYEGGIRVPAIVRWPGVVRRGNTSAQVAISMDWTATFLAAANAQAHPGYPLDGQDLLPVLSGWQPERSRELFWRMRGKAAARVGDLKYLQVGGTEYLYDLAADVREQANLAPLQPEVLASLRNRYQAWNASVLPQA